MLGVPLHRQVAVLVRIVIALAVLFAVAACDPAFGLGLPSERALEDGAANTLTHAKSLEIKGSYTSGAGAQWTVDTQLVRPDVRHTTITGANLKVEAIVIGGDGFFRGQAFLAAHMGSDPLSQNLARAAGNAWWKGPAGYVPRMTEFTDGAAFRTTFLGSVNTQRADRQSVDGQPAVQLSGRRADVFISATPPHHLLRVHLKNGAVIDGMSAVDFKYSAFDQDFKIVAPTDVIDFSNLSTLPPIYTVESVDTSRCTSPCIVQADLRNLGGAMGAIAPSTVTFTMTGSISGTALGSCQTPVIPDVGYNQTITVGCTINASGPAENPAVVTAAATNPGRGSAPVNP